MLCTLLLTVSCKENKSGEVLDYPNVVWIIIEDMSPDLSCYGHDLVKTPNIDALAQKGIRYHKMYATGVACSPSRTSLVTGFYQNYLGAHHMRYPEELKPPLPDSIKPIHIHLQEHGYQTANIRTFPGNGKTDWLFKYDANSYDYNQWEEIDPHQPFFARINLRLTHRPFEADTMHPINPDLVKLPPYYPDHPIAREDFKDYYESIQVVDRQVGMVLESIREKGLDKNTVIFFFSDHGRPMPRGKNFLYDSGIRVPLIISTLDDEVRSHYQLQGENNGLYSLIDVTATTLDITGLSTIYSQGISLLNDKEGRDYVWAAADRIGEIHFKSRMIRDGRFKYIRNYIHDLSVNEASTAHRKSIYPIYHLLNFLGEEGELSPAQQKLIEPMVEEELYDIQTDPYEVHNLIDIPAHQQALQNLRHQLSIFTNQIQDQGMLEDPPELFSAFEAYGRNSFDKNKMRILQLQNHVAQRINNE